MPLAFYIPGRNRNAQRRCCTTMCCHSTGSMAYGGRRSTDNGREFCGTENHPYELYLALNDIEHRRTKVKSPKTNGFIERFNKTVLDEFFRIAFRENFYESVEALQEDLDQWLIHYNTERPHRGYRNRGKRPLDTVLDYA